MNSVTIIIPTLNEEGNIDPLLDQISNLSVDDCTLDILFVDDQSTDDTISKIKYWQQRSKNISVLQRHGTPDLTKSVMDGAAQCTTDFIVVMDADLSHPINKIPELLEPLIANTHDIVVGSRYVKSGGATNWPAHRRFLSWFGGLPARVLTDVNDTTSGFFACRRNCFEQIDPNARGYKVLLELLVAGLDKFRTTEVPILFTDRVQGQSKLSSKQLIQYFQRLLELSGASVSSTTAKRFLSVGLLGVVIDALIFHLLLNIGWSISSAHITSFFIAASSNYFFNSIWSFEYRHQSLVSWISKASKYVFFGLIALTIRGGVLAILVDLFEVSPTIAIYAAIIAAAIVNYFGASFIVFPNKDNNKDSSLSLYWRICAVAAVAFMVTLRFLYMGTAELIPDEAYYWNYKEYLDLSYLDHPPLLAWSIWLGTTIFGDNEFGVRIIAFLCGLGVIIYIFRLTNLLFDRTSAYIAILLVSTLPFTVAPGFFATTDTLLMLFWSACLYFLAKILVNKSPYAWLGIGICVGLGMLSKYSMVLLAFSIIILVTIDRSLRTWWKQPPTYISAIIAVILFLPVLYWNASHEWSSFLFQTSRRLDRTSEFSTHYILLHLFILLTPVGIYLYSKSLFNIKRLVSFHTNKSALSSSYIYYFTLLTLLPISVFIYFSFTHYPRFHWTAPIWLALVPLAAYSLSPTSKVWSLNRITSKIVIYSCGILCLLYGTILHYSALGLPLDLSNKFSGHYFWKQTAQQVHQLEKNIKIATGQTPLIVGLSKWSVASALRFYDADKQVDNIVSRNAVTRPATMFEQWTDPTRWGGHPVIFIAINPNDLHSKEVKAHTINLQPPKKVIISFNNNELRVLHYRIAERYQP